MTQYPKEMITPYQTPKDLKRALQEASRESSKIAIDLIEFSKLNSLKQNIANTQYIHSL